VTRQHWKGKGPTVSPNRPGDGEVGQLAGAVAGIGKPSGGSWDLGRFLRKNILFEGLTVIVVALTFLSPVFLSVDNVFDIVLQSSISAIIALGMTFVITTGGIDLSVGAIWALTGVIAGMLLRAGISPIVAVPAGILSGAFCGLFTGLLITKGRIQPFIATLATMSVFRGITLIITRGYTVYGFPREFEYLGAGRLGGVIPIPVVILAAVFALSLYLFEQTTFGRYLVSIGNNREAARLCGINVDRVITWSYVYCGVLSAIGGGIIATARLNAAEPIAGSGSEVLAIAAVVIGGTSMAGGETKIKRTIVGALLLGTVSNGLTLLNVPTYYQMAVIGLIIILAMLGEAVSRD
jgi:ribose transport system permease protein